MMQAAPAGASTRPDWRRCCAPPRSWWSGTSPTTPPALCPPRPTSPAWWSGRPCRRLALLRRDVPAAGTGARAAASSRGGPLRRAVSLAGMSKAFGLAGLRIGWVAARDQGLLERMTALKDYTTICSSAPSELLALMALRSPEPILAANRARVERNTRTAADFFARHRDTFGWTPPQAGTVCFPRLLGGGAWAAANRRRKRRRGLLRRGVAGDRRASAAVDRVRIRRLSLPAGPGQGVTSARGSRRWMGSWPPAGAPRRAPGPARDDLGNGAESSGALRTAPQGV